MACSFDVKPLNVQPSTHLLTFIVWIRRTSQKWKDWPFCYCCLGHQDTISSPNQRPRWHRGWELPLFRRLSPLNSSLSSPPFRKVGWITSTCHSELVWECRWSHCETSSSVSAWLDKSPSTQKIRQAFAGQQVQSEYVFIFSSIYLYCERQKCRILTTSH